MFKYIKLGKILQEVIQHGKQLKTALYNNQQIKSTQIPMAYSLLSLVINNYDAIKLVQNQIAIKTQANICNPYLMCIMIAQLVNTGKIVGGGQLKKIIIQHQHLIPLISKSSKINKQTVQLRLRAKDTQFNTYQHRISQIGRKDTLIPNMYHLEQDVYSQLTKDTTLNILQSSACVMQSFSSALPPFLLLKGVQNKWKNRKYNVIDACSAPGNKTVQLAQYNNSGRIYAFQKNQKRFQLLNRTIKKFKVGNIIASNEDFLLVKSKAKYKRVKFILLDPSCSGSGMLTNFTRDRSGKQQDVQQSFQEFCNKRYNELSQQDKKRIENLHTFQLQLLNHAASQFKPLRISYSTCSIYKRQNEDVVEAFLNNNPSYRIKPFAFPQNQLISSGFGNKYKNCIRVDPRKMESDGFFVVVFTRGLISN